MDTDKTYVYYAPGTAPCGTSVVATIELLGKTNVSDLLHAPKEPFISPFYTGGLINCGRVVRIQGTEKDYTTVTLCFSGAEDDKEFTIANGKLFYITGCDYDKGRGLRVFRYKAGALNDASYVSPTFSGVKYKFFPSGRLNVKARFTNGDLCAEHVYRDDQWNTLSEVKIHATHTSYAYDQHERLVKTDLG